MISFNNITAGITTKCNAKCSMCSREKIQPYDPNFNLTHDINLDCITPILKHTESIAFSGCYGEPTLHKQFLEYIKFIKKEYSELNISLSSNVGTNNLNFWTKLGSYNVDALCCIDGIGETNKIYRGLSYNKCLDNMKAFIDGGGNCTWTTLYFEFNKDQIDEMEKIAKSIGCKKFILRRSDSYLGDVNLNSNIKSRNDLYHEKKLKKLYCKWNDKKLLYINEFGYVMPCCHIDEVLVRYKTDIPNIKKFFNKHIDKLNLNKYTIYEIFPYIEQFYNDINTMEICLNKCKYNKQIIDKLYLIKEIKFI